MPRPRSATPQAEGGEIPHRNRHPYREAHARRQALLFLCISALCAIAVLATRNLYDDEISSLPIITGSVRSIIQFTRSGDVHPPGMYLLAHAAYGLLPSFRWMNLFPLAVLYAGLSVFVLAIAPLFRDVRSRAWFLLLATLHPQLLLWGTSFRWYSWWTGLALITLVVALQPRQVTPVLSGPRCIALGILLAALFYLNYVTLIFAVCLAAGVIFRYRRAGSRWMQPALSATAIFVILAAPQVRRMLQVFAERGSEQRMAITGSVARLLAATFASEAYLPWNPLAIAAALAMGLLVVSFLWRRRKRDVDTVPVHPALQAILVVGGLFFVFIALSGLGGKPRTALLLAPTLAVAVACAARALPVRLHHAGLLLIALWSAGGLTHMLARTGLSKSMMVDRPEQVVNFIRATSAPGCAIVTTYDPTLAFAFSHPPLARTVLISPYLQPVAVSGQPVPGSCSDVTLYVVHSYIGGDSNFADSIDRELDAAAQLISGKPQTARLSRDPNAAGRRAVARLPVVGGQSEAARLPDYRYRVVAGTVDASAIRMLPSRLPDFCAYPCPAQLPSPQ